MSYSWVEKAKVILRKSPYTRCWKIKPFSSNPGLRNFFSTELKIGHSSRKRGRNRKEVRPSPFAMGMLPCFKCPRFCWNTPKSGQHCKEVEDKVGTWACWDRKQRSHLLNNYEWPSQGNPKTSTKRTLKYWRNKFKRAWEHKKTSCAPGLAELILWKWSYHWEWPTGSMQTFKMLMYLSQS